MASTCVDHSVDGTGDRVTEDTVSVLMKQRLVDMLGKAVTVLTVDYMPGVKSGPARPSGSVFVHALEGVVVLNYGGREANDLYNGSELV